VLQRNHQGQELSGGRKLISHRLEEILGSATTLTSARRSPALGQHHGTNGPQTEDKPGRTFFFSFLKLIWMEGSSKALLRQEEKTTRRSSASAGADRFPGAVLPPAALTGASGPPAPSAPRASAACAGFSTRHAQPSRSRQRRGCVDAAPAARGRSAATGGPGRVPGLGSRAGFPGPALATHRRDPAVPHASERVPEDPVTPIRKPFCPFGLRRNINGKTLRVDTSLWLLKQNEGNIAKR